MATPEPNEDGFVRASFRVLASNLLPSAPSEIVQLDEGAKQYEPCEGFIDVGVSRTGIQFKPEKVVVIGFAQVHQHAVIAKKRGGTRHLVALCQHKETKQICGWLFTNVELIWNIDGPPKGEASMLPAHFRYDEALSIMQENLEVVVDRPNPFQRPGETPQKTGTRFEQFFARLLGVDPVRGSGNQWHAPLDVGDIKLLLSLKWSSKDVLRFGRYQIWELFRETREATKSSDRVGALTIREESTGKTYVIFEAEDFLRMSQTGDIHYMTPSKGEQKRARSRVPALLREEEDA